MNDKRLVLFAAWVVMTACAAIVATLIALRVTERMATWPTTAVSLIIGVAVGFGFGSAWIAALSWWERHEDAES